MLSAGNNIPLFGLLLLGLIGLLLWPRLGLVWRWRRDRQSRLRVRVEDALKQFYFCETESQPPTLTGIAGRLQISENAAAHLLETMQQRGLVAFSGDQFELTPAGRTYALHIVRAHRLWERYLADQTGVREQHWHGQAEQMEHMLSTDDTDALASRLGYPLMDPHGDPIPTSEGELAGARGQPLTTLPANKTARILHLEDEPDIVYAQLVAEGFYPGQIVYVLEQSPSRVRVWAAGEEHRLAPMVAAAISAELVALAAPPAPMESLADLKTAESAHIREISSRCRGVERRRLLDLGIVPGTLVTAELVSPTGDPTAYRLRNTLIALRRDQADLVKIERTPSPTYQSTGNGKASE